MNERLAKAEALFHEALELAPEEREVFLQSACGADAELRQEVTALLRASGIADAWLKECESGVFRPIFQSLRTLNGGGVAMSVRGWHGQPVILEASTDLQQWVPVHTNTMSLPTFEYHNTNGNGAAQRFYRASVP